MFLTFLCGGCIVCVDSADINLMILLLPISSHYLKQYLSLVTK